MTVVESHGVYDVQDMRGGVHDGLQGRSQEQFERGLQNSAFEDAPGMLVEGYRLDHQSD